MSNDRKRIEQIREQLKLDHPLSVETGVFLLAQIDVRDGTLRAVLKLVDAIKAFYAYDETLGGEMIEFEYLRIEASKFKEAACKMFTTLCKVLELSESGEDEQEALAHIHKLVTEALEG